MTSTCKKLSVTRCEISRWMTTILASGCLGFYLILSCQVPWLKNMCKLKNLDFDAFFYTGLCPISWDEFIFQWRSLLLCNEQIVWQFEHLMTSSKEDSLGICWGSDQIVSRHEENFTFYSELSDNVFSELQKCFLVVFDCLRWKYLLSEFRKGQIFHMISNYSWSIGSITSANMYWV